LSLYTCIIFIHTIVVTTPSIDMHYIEMDNCVPPAVYKIITMIISLCSTSSIQDYNNDYKSVSLLMLQLKPY